MTNPKTFLKTLLSHAASHAGALACALALIPQTTHSDVLKLNNGDTLTGTINSLDDTTVSLASPMVVTPLEITSASVSRITFPSQTKDTPFHTERITLTNGDTLPCEIISMDAKTLNIATWYAGNFSIPRTQLKTLQFGITKEKNLYTGNDAPSKWEKKEGLWSLSGTNTYRSRGIGALARKLDLAKNVRFNFDLAWKDTPKFAFRFCAENDSHNTKQNTYEFLFNSAGMQISRYPSSTEPVAPLANIPIKPNSISDKSVNIDIRVNRTDGMISLSVDGETIGTWPDDSPPADGSYIVLANNSSSKNYTSVKNLRVFSMSDGSMPRHREKLANTKTDVLVDSEGEKISGNLASITTTETNKRVITLSRKHTPDLLRVPDHRISTLLFATPEQSPDHPQAAFSAILDADGSISLNNPQFLNGKITCQHPILGPCTIDIKSLAHIKRSTLPKTTNKKQKKQPTKPEARLLLVNGDQLTGLPIESDDKQQLSFTADSLRQTVNFPINNILAIDLNSWKETPAAKTIARVQLQPRFREPSGDTLLGALHELTPENIKLKTWYGGTITLKRSMVQSLKIVNKTPGNYLGPNKIEEWSTPNGTNSWAFKRGTLTSLTDGSIGKDIGLRENTHISFTMEWKNSMRFKLQLYSSDVTETSPDAYYEISINRTYAYLRTRGKNKRGGIRLGGGRWKQINIPPTENQARFDIYVSRKTGNINIYINGNQACMLQSQSPDPENLGTGLTFIAEKRYPVTISSISVSPWNGTSLPKLKTDDKKDGDADKEQKPPHKIILNNGDEVPGTVGKVQDNRMIINTQYTPIRIPLDRIKSLSLGDAGEQPIKKRGDVRAWFHYGGHVTLQLKSLKDGKITGFSQAIGDASFDLAAFSRVDFHIYDDKANKRRESAQ